MGTDDHWEQWAREDPYYSVLTLPQFRSAHMDQEAMAQFFASGEFHVRTVLENTRRLVDPEFSPTRVLDFGCGTGRLVIPFAAVAQDVVGTDVSATMLDLAKRHCDEQGVGNVSLVLSDDEVSALEGEFDFIHSVFVFQHIPVDRGRIIFRNLLRHLAPGGVGAVHFMYGRTPGNSSVSTSPFGTVRPRVRDQPTVRRVGLAARSVLENARHRDPPHRDPEIQMNQYSLGELYFLLQEAGIAEVHAELTDYDGELGTYLYFRLPDS